MNRLIPFLALALAAAGLAGCQRSGDTPSNPTGTQVHAGETDQGRTAPAPGGAGERQILYYRNPHKPEITSPVPRKDEMGMDYIAVYADESEGGIRVGPEVRHSLGVRTAPVVLGLLPRALRGVGFVTWDQDRVRHIHSRAEGWVERWNVAAIGDAVKKGQVLFELYSPAMATAEEEFVQALKIGNPRLVSAAARKLQALGVPAENVERLRETRQPAGRMPFRAEADGIVIEIAAREGMYVPPMTDVLIVADLSRVWVEADILASKGAWLRQGLPAVVTVESVPGREWVGEVTWVYPQVDPVSRAQRVRMAFANPDGVLLPGAWASVRVQERASTPVLHVPRDALIRSGTGQRVIVETADGRFAPRAVETGYESDGRLVVLAGLAPEERVVTSGQFLLDSEASLRGELERLDSAEAVPGNKAVPGGEHSGHGTTGMDHSSHEMADTEHAGHDAEGGRRP